jgi:3,4-dihydroxy 2-butanone 4-phosphate synthase/GTP cyclohydrolase II
VVYATDVEETEYLALVLGEVSPDKPVLVRVQTGAPLRDAFGAAASEDDHAATVSLRMIEEAGSGILLYVYPRGRVSMAAELRAFGGTALVGDAGNNGAKAASRAPALTDIGLGAQVLVHLGVRAVRLLTNHPRRIVGLAGYGIEVAECVAIRPPARVVPIRDAGDGGKRSA